MPPNTTVQHPGMQRFRVAMPAATHRAKASCEDVDCPNYLRGWTTIVDTGVAMGEAQARYLRLNPRKLDFSVVKKSEYELAFIYPPGQECFSDHTVLNGREPYYLHETSDGRRIHKAEDFIEHAKEEIQKNVGKEERHG